MKRERNEERLRDWSIFSQIMKDIVCADVGVLEKSKIGMVFSREAALASNHKTTLKTLYCLMITIININKII